MVRFALRSLAHYARYATINRDPRNEDPALDRGESFSPLAKNKNKNNLDFRLLRIIQAMHKRKE